ncbi:sodium-coupled monocarboxylate transporter 1-like [Asterias rubens]|uniref:sodium-coupled monocarboxylate transporter 1-like n=1 Tax=Asterias rubens TaxID=7604 RepID=UPI001455A5AE|nr:sodium-coupled monocarboxylate transporter 1-like [Asterias rubens]
MEAIFHWADYVVLVVMLLASASIGIFYAFRSRGQNSSGNFMMADRKMGSLPVGISMVASLFSGIYIQGSVSETYFRGIINFAGAVIPLTISGVIAGRIFMPKFYELELKTVYQYLELRFGVTVRNCCLVLGYAFGVMQSGLVTYAASLVLSTVTGSKLSVFTCTVILSAVCTFYTVIGGIKAVLWADCFQMCLVIASLIAAATQAVIQIGFGEIWLRNLNGGRINFFNFDPDPRVYVTFWTVIIGGTFSWLPPMSVLQIQVQRYGTCKSQQTAHMAFGVFVAGCILLTSLCVIAGVSMYALYVDCDPLSAGYLREADGLLPYYILNAFQHLPGVPGLMISGLCSAALSTTSSILNSIATITSEHVISNIWKDLPDSRYLMITRLVAMIFGCVTIASATLGSRIGSIFPAVIGVIGVFNGPIFAVFFLGLFFRRANSQGTIVGFVVGASIGVWIFIGSLIYLPLPGSLELRTDGCEDYDFAANATTDSSVMNVVTTMMSMVTNESSTLVPPVATSRPFVIELYNISRLWYPTLCIVLVVVVGLVASLIFEAIAGKQEVDSALLWNWRESCCCCPKTSQDDDKKVRITRIQSVSATFPDDAGNKNHDDSKETGYAMGELSSTAVE